MFSTHCISLSSDSTAFDATVGNHVRSHEQLIQISAFTARDNRDCTKQKVCFSILADRFVVRWGTNIEVNTSEQYGKSLAENFIRI